MQSESGIVPDFEVGEDFQDEPKTYYELKSQPLKNRSVFNMSHWRWTVTFLSHAGALHCAQVLIGWQTFRSVYPSGMFLLLCACERARERESPPGDVAAAGLFIPCGLSCCRLEVMQVLGVVLSTSTSNISSWRSRRVRDW